MLFFCVSFFTLFLNAAPKLEIVKAGSCPSQFQSSSPNSMRYLTTQSFHSISVEQARDGKWLSDQLINNEQYQRMLELGPDLHNSFLYSLMRASLLSAKQHLQHYDSISNLFELNSKGELSLRYHPLRPNFLISSKEKESVITMDETNNLGFRHIAAAKLKVYQELMAELSASSKSFSYLDYLSFSSSLVLLFNDFHITSSSPTNKELHLDVTSSDYAQRIYTQFSIRANDKKQYNEFFSNILLSFPTIANFKPSDIERLNYRLHLLKIKPGRLAIQESTHSYNDSMDFFSHQIIRSLDHQSRLEKLKKNQIDILRRLNDYTQDRINEEENLAVRWIANYVLYKLHNEGKSEQISNLVSSLLSNKPKWHNHLLEFAEAQTLRIIDDVSVTSLRKTNPQIFSQLSQDHIELAKQAKELLESILEDFITSPQAKFYYKNLNKNY